MTLDSESPEELYSEELSTEKPEPKEIEETEEQQDEYSDNKTGYFEDNLEEQQIEYSEDETKLSESEIEEQQDPEQTGKNILISFLSTMTKPNKLQLHTLACLFCYYTREKI